MLDALYWIAALLAAAGVRKGHWTALPLLASVAFCLVARAFHVPFNLWLWLAVDVLAAAAIAWPLYPIIRARAWEWLSAYWRELAILALFVPGVASYAMPPKTAYLVSTATATAQLLIAVPYRRLGREWKRTMLRYREWTHIDLRVAAC